MKRRATTGLLVALPLFIVGACYAKISADRRVLSAIGYRPADGSPTAFFADRAKDGLTPGDVARAMPEPTKVERFIAPVVGGDSVLLERYIYSRAVGRWDAYIYYRRGGGVFDVYAQDVPGIRGARSVSASEAEAWRRWPAP